MNNNLYIMCSELIQLNCDLYIESMSEYLLIGVRMARNLWPKQIITLLGVTLLIPICPLIADVKESGGGVAYHGNRRVGVVLSSN
jgi:hypothetical protein